MEDHGRTFSNIPPLKSFLLSYAVPTDLPSQMFQVIYGSLPSVSGPAVS